MSELDRHQTDVLLIDLDEEVERSPEMLDALMERALVPVLFNDGVQGRLDFPDSDHTWQHRLVEKVMLVARRSMDDSSRAEVAYAKAAIPKRFPATAQQRAGATLPETRAADAIWVLGASVGGPQAVKAFLSALPAELAVAFILVQHIGSPFVSFLARQLDKASSMNVIPAREGLRLSPRQVVVAPVEEALTVGLDGHLKLQAIAEQGSYRPSINAIMVHVAERFGDRAGAIVFSGMGDDGTRGCKAIAARGGVVWAQDAESCFISSMPDHARATGLVSFSASPEILAQELVGYLARSGIESGEKNTDGRVQAGKS
jgi:chemosensory pili system protein ChpB (putative protein-glutamate methylesterase)